MNLFRFTFAMLAICGGLGSQATAAEIVGVSVIPHSVETSMRYRHPRDPDLAARVQLFVKGRSRPTTFDGHTPAELLASNDWAWHDLSAAVESPNEALTVWSFNGKSSRWGVGKRFALKGMGLQDVEVPIAAPEVWISAATFLASDNGVQPDTVVIHLANQSTQEASITSMRFWLPKDRSSWQVLWPQQPIPISAKAPPKDKGFLTCRVPRLPLTYAAIELSTNSGPIWAHLRIKREAFDVSGGWVGEKLTKPSYLQLLTHMHVNTGHIGSVPGYTDNPSLYEKWPLKLFNKLDPLAAFDTEAWLPKIHAVEFLGEPQYGGGRPVPPQEVFDALLPYRTSRLATSVTHSEERIWRWYAGLSDFPHYDAYRVVAPSPDAWALYDRWGDRKIRWGAPLETIGDMCRSLRELNRPMPCAYWSQGPADGWGGGFDGRKRRSPTPDELRAQALHALSTRITSLYWFNLSLKLLLKFPDTWEPITRVGREIKMLEPFFLEGDAYRFERLARDGEPDWDLASVAAPDAALLFALDTAYTADKKDNVFAFGAPRAATFNFALPHWLRGPTDVFRVDADGIHEVKWRVEGSGVVIDDTRSRDAIYLATKSLMLRRTIEQRRQAALAHEAANPIEQNELQALLK
jgi:hypothetical protein